jgi:hypothetical protein
MKKKLIDEYQINGTIYEKFLTTKPTILEFKRSNTGQLNKDGKSGLDMRDMHSMTLDGPYRMLFHFLAALILTDKRRSNFYDIAESLQITNSLYVANYDMLVLMHTILTKDVKEQVQSAIAMQESFQSI